ncbi:unnamed protein product [Phytophthora fragariaefolia]|uniref:Unnamed protein product n=1 Tax=Phytophthora fragariaefolia TaxID=1490495 RepID=A0A9W6U491_9STRA|nr:unnamed protein product [Phytophthora fragariaefolia]
MSSVSDISAFEHFWWQFGRETSTLLSPRQPPEAFHSAQFDTLVALVGLNSTTMASKTRKNTQEATTAHGEGQNTLEAQLADLRAELATLRANRQVQPARPTETRPRVPSGLPKFKGKRGEDVRQWLFQVETLCRIHGHDGDNDNIHRRNCDGRPSIWVASNYQAVLRQKLRQLRQLDDIEDYNGKYSALIFRVENLSAVDQVSYYCDGLKRATQAFVKLQNTMTLSEAMDQAVKHEMSHFSGDHKVNREKPEREPRFRGPPRPTSGSKKKPFTNRSYKPGHYLPTAQSKEGPGPDVARASKEDLTVNEITLNMLCEDPLVYNRAPLFSVDGEIIQSDNKFKTKFLLDCGATTVYVSRAFVKEYGSKTQVYTERTIRVKLGDNKMGEAILGLVTIEIRLKNVPNYQCVAVVFDIPEEFDCVLGMPYFVDVQPAIDWSVDASRVTSSPSAISHDSCRAAVPETRLEDEVEIVERPTEDGRKPSKRERKNAKAEAMFNLGVVDSDGVETKYIARKKLRKFLRLSGKDGPEHDFMVVLTNETIKRIEQDLKRNDEPTMWVRKKRSDSFTQIGNHSITTPRTPMAGAYYFSCMDLMSAYYQVRMKLNHTKYTAFQAPSGLYECLVLPMGVSDAPATMHRLTSSLFEGSTHTRSFYDDIYVFTKSKDIDEHLRALRDVLEF